MGREFQVFPGNYYAGGQFMATSKSICATTLDTSNYRLASEEALSWPGSDLKWLRDVLGCEKVITMPGLPNEGTRHIDLFAKFIDDDTVLVADYPNNDIVLEGLSLEVSFECDTQSIEAEDWFGCVSGRRAQDVPINQGVDLRIGSDEDFKNFVSKNNFNLSSSYEHGQIREHADKVAKLFQDQGFKVVRVTNPIPTAKLATALYRDSSGKILHRSTELEFTHRSYTNSLVSNGNLYLPTYQSFDSLNIEAHNTYKNFGLKVYDIDMSEFIKDGGAVHCLTKDLH
jgi:agmatine/peptidylarginine deiminase